MSIIELVVTIATGCINFWRNIEIVPNVNCWSFTIALFCVAGVCSVFWRSGKG